MMLDKVKSILCVLWGHPPVVHTCFGELTCARCGNHVGDTLCGFATTKGKMVVGHNCGACQIVWKSMPWWQRLLTDRKNR